MNRQLTARSPPLLAERSTPVRRRRRIGEVAGGTAAECAAVWCCFPCVAIDVLVLALFKVPAGLCRRAWSRRKNKKKRKKNMRGKRLGGGGAVALPTSYGPTIEELERKVGGLDVAGDDDVAAAMEEEEDEVWGRFSTSGFWRSPSLRDED